MRQTNTNARRRYARPHQRQPAAPRVGTAGAETAARFMGGIIAGVCVADKSGLTLIPAYAMLEPIAGLGGPASCLTCEERTWVVGWVTRRLGGFWVSPTSGL